MDGIMGGMNEIESLYIHFPFCRHQCNYCDFYKRVPSSSEEVGDFERYLLESWSGHENLLEEQGYVWGELQTLYLGGGTPSLWGSAGAAFLSSFLEQRGVTLSPQGEVTLEVNPGGWTLQGLRDWRGMGVNRYSLGIQSLEPFFLKVLDRIHSPEDVFESLDFFHREGVDYSVDFMLGLPFSRSKKRDVVGELEKILCYQPQHISLYILTLKEGHSLFKKLADEDLVAGEYLSVSEYLRGKGYEHYEVSNFARPGRESRHNIKYWHSETVAALGPSATGFLAERGLRYKWQVAQTGFKAEHVTGESGRMERFYSALRLKEGPVLEDFFNQEQLSRAIPLVEGWCGSERGALREGRVCLNPRGFLSMDGLMDQFFKQGLL